jgi:hypothetical protein
MRPGALIFAFALTFAIVIVAFVVVVSFSAVVALFIIVVVVVVAVAVAVAIAPSALVESSMHSARPVPRANARLLKDVVLGVTDLLGGRITKPGGGGGVADVDIILIFNRPGRCCYVVVNILYGSQWCLP